MIKVGFPMSEGAAQAEKYATLTIDGIDGYDAKLGMTGIPVIIAALKEGRNPNSLSSYIVRDAVYALETLHKRMWEMCENGDKV